MREQSRTAHRRLLPIILALTAGCGGSTAAPTGPTSPPSIQTIVEFTGGRATVVGGAPHPVLGQSATIRQGPFNSLRFQWQTYGPVATVVPSATGRVYLLDREYLGPVAGLSPSTAGVIGISAPGGNGEYVFDSAIVVQPNTKYWFYSNDQTEERLLVSIDRDLYPDGNMYVKGVAERFMVFDLSGRGDERADANFVLRGRPVQ